MNKIGEAKTILPLPKLMDSFGLGKLAKQSARCPFHNDKRNSFSVYKNRSGEFRFKCHAGCGAGDEITFLELHEKLTQRDATKRFLYLAGLNGATPARSTPTFDWQECVEKFGAEHLERLSEWRGYSGEFCSWLKQSGLVGIVEGCIAFPVHNNGQVVAAHVLWHAKDGLWRYLPTGAKTRPLVIGELLPGETVHVFESQWDGFALMAVSGERSGIIITRGASNGALVADVIPQSATVYLWPQNDAPGEKWAKDVCAHTNCAVKSAKTPAQFADLNDWTRGGATDKDLLDAMVNAETLREPGETSANPPETAPCRPLRVEPPSVPMDFKQWHAVISDNFPAFARAAEICASVFAQLLMNDVANPFALALVDVPSSGKTITLNFFDVKELAYTTDSFTPASFVSHASNVKREDLANVDMLPRIRFRALIVRDLASIFGAKEDELLKTIGILTRALDGEGLETDSGVHGKRGYKGDWLFMLLAGTTPIPPRVFKVMGTLGSRLFFLALHSKRKSNEQLMSQNRGIARQEKERTCREATDTFLRSLWAANPGGVEWDKNGDPDNCLRVVARCAQLLAALRGTIQMWLSDHDSTVSYSVPVIEQPDRINTLLCNLARGHALLCGRRQLAPEDLAPVLEITFDSATTIRSKVFRGLLENGGTLKTAQVEKLLRCSNPTALKEMEALSVLGVADKTEPVPGYSGQELKLSDEFQWFAGDECKTLRW
jgi:CHC2 zinc finger